MNNELMDSNYIRHFGWGQTRAPSTKCNDIPFAKYSQQINSQGLWVGNADQFSTTLSDINRPLTCYDLFMSKNTVRLISEKVSQLLQGVDPHGRKIVIPDDIIGNVMDQVYISYQPNVGSIYSRYQVPSGTSDNMAQNMINQTIEIIYNDVKNEADMIKHNQSLNVWDSVLGDFNKNGLRQYSKIYVREKRPDPMQFHMRY
jgi:hypothetical protein